MVSRRLKVRVKLSRLKAYQIAHVAGLHPSTLSRILHGVEKVSDGDSRVVAIGKVVGLDPEQCFEHAEGGGG
jgi:hypothetical protein